MAARAPSTLPPGPASSSDSPATRQSGESYDLAADETRGGHTLARHVGRTDDELRARLARETSISAASTYTDRATAERTVARTLARHADRVAAWVAREGNRLNLALTYRGPTGETIGRTLQRGQRSSAAATSAVVVLRWDGDRGHYVLTSYPEARR